jgi:hypothetical protein
LRLKGINQILVKMFYTDGDQNGPWCARNALGRVRGHRVVPSLPHGSRRATDQVDDMIATKRLIFSELAGKSAEL